MRRDPKTIHQFMRTFEQVRQQTHHTNETAYLITEERIARENGRTFYRNYNSFRASRTYYMRNLHKKGSFLLK